MQPILGELLVAVRRHGYLLFVTAIVALAHSALLFFLPSSVKTSALMSGAGVRHIVVHQRPLGSITSSSNAVDTGSSTAQLNQTPVAPRYTAESRPPLQLQAPTNAHAPKSAEFLAASATAPSWVDTSAALYLPLDELDVAAEPLTDLGLEFGKIFPVLSGSVIVEFWISNSGKVAKVDIKKGTTLIPMDLALNEMLGFEFLPAMLANSVVASRKLVEIDTNRVTP